MIHMLQTRIAARGNALTFGGAADWPLSRIWKQECDWHHAETAASRGVIFPRGSTWSWQVTVRLFDDEGDSPPCEWGDGECFHGAINAASVVIAQIVSRRRRGEVIGPEGWLEPAALSGAERAASFRARLRKARGQ